MPDSLLGGRWTAAEVAKAQNIETYERYLRILEDMELEDLSLKDIEQEEFFDTEESVGT
jgi:hypothetical protein